MSSRLRRSARIAGLAGYVMATTAGGALLADLESDATATQNADALWLQRAQGYAQGRATTEPIGRAISAYEKLVDAAPRELEPRWKLLRALHFYGEYALIEADDQLAVFERGRDLADDGRGDLGARLGLEPDERDPEIVAGAVSRAVSRGAVEADDAAQLYFYSAIHWGLWGERTGRMKAARQGVAGRIRDYAQTVVLIDEHLADAGGLRFLGRLHTDAPRIPFVTGWVDRQQAVADLERACELAPDEPANQVYLADALLRFTRGREREAIERLEHVVASPPRPHNLVEDSTTIAEARRLLAAQR